MYPRNPLNHLIGDEFYDFRHDRFVLAPNPSGGCFPGGLNPAIFM